MFHESDSTSESPGNVMLVSPDKKGCQSVQAMLHEHWSAMTVGGVKNESERLFSSCYDEQSALAQLLI